MASLIALPSWLSALPDAFASWEESWFTRTGHVDSTAIFTGVLVFVGVCQLALFFWQLRLIRESLSDAQKAAEAGAEAANAASRQARVAEDSLAKLERPYLFVSNVSPLKTEEIEGLEELEIGPGHWLSITYSVANYGKIPAIIKYAQAHLVIAPVDPTVPPRLEYSHDLVSRPIFAAAEARDRISEYLQWDGDVYNDEYQTLYPNLKGEELFFWIIINYRGPFTDQHETRVCFRYDAATNRLIGPHGGQEYSGEK